jgi:serine/threonine-protein kinase RsbW
VSGQAYDQRAVLSGEREEIESMQQSLLEAAERLEYDETSRFAIRLALEEALSNAIKHGNKDDPGKRVTVVWAVNARHVAISIEDEGQGFDPNTVPDPTQSENIEIPAGRGIVLMRSFMSEVNFHPPGNRVEMRFERK